MNPSDLRRPSLLSLAGVDLGTDTDITSNSIVAKTHESTATMNLVAVARLLDVICTGCFSSLLALEARRTISASVVSTGHFHRPLESGSRQYDWETAQKVQLFLGLGKQGLSPTQDTDPRV